MLMLVFEAGNDRFALEACDVVEVVPAVQLRQLPRAPECFAGLLSYRGILVPVFDLALLVNSRGSRDLLSTRIIVIRCPGREGDAALLGLRAERVTETVRIAGEDLTPPPISIPGVPYLGQIAQGRRGMIQCIRPEHLVPKPLLDTLYSEMAAQP
jgi:chemotaxis-related protein WspB